MASTENKESKNKGKGKNFGQRQSGGSSKQSNPAMSFQKAAGSGPNPLNYMYFNKGLAPINALNTAWKGNAGDPNAMFQANANNIVRRAAAGQQTRGGHQMQFSSRGAFVTKGNFGRKNDGSQIIFGPIPVFVNPSTPQGLEIKSDLLNAGALKMSNVPGKLFIGGLNIVTTDEGLRQFYSQFGHIVDCIVMRDPATKKSRCFGFVSFATQEEADRAMAAKPHVIDNKTVEAKPAMQKAQFVKGERNVSTEALAIREQHTEDALNEGDKGLDDHQEIAKLKERMTEMEKNVSELPAIKEELTNVKASYQMLLMGRETSVSSDEQEQPKVSKKGRAKRQMQLGIKAGGSPKKQRKNSESLGQSAFEEVINEYGFIPIPE